MQSLAPLLGPQSVITWAGARTTELQDDGSVRPWRLPHADAPLYTGLHNGAAGLHNLAGMAAGVRITFMTTADTVELTVAVQGGGELMFDLCSPGQQIMTKRVKSDVPAGASTETTWSSYQTLLFDGVGGAAGAGADKLCEIWMPHIGVAKVKDVRISDGAQASRYIDRRPRWTTYGSSISHCGEAFSPALTWPATCARTAGLNLYCLGFGGNCNFDLLVAREIRDCPADAISLKLGINMGMSHNTRAWLRIPVLCRFPYSGME